MNLTLLSREDWEADPNLPRRGHHLGPLKRTEVFIHHTVIVDSDTTINEFENLDEVKAATRRLQTIRPDLGLDVPYNFVAFFMSDGSLVLGEGRGLGQTGAHTHGHNRSAIGIAFQGNLEELPLPVHFDSQLAMLADWLRKLRVEEGFENLGSVRPTDREVWGHRDAKATLCPGENLFQKLSLIRFVEDALWQKPGDPIKNAEDERRLIEAQGSLVPDQVGEAIRRPSEQ